MWHITGAIVRRMCVCRGREGAYVCEIEQEGALRRNVDGSGVLTVWSGSRGVGGR